MHFPGVAQMVERVVWDHEAAGSRPVTRTKTPLKPMVSEEFLHFFDLSLQIVSLKFACSKLSTSAVSK